MFLLALVLDFAMGGFRLFISGPISLVTRICTLSAVMATVMAVFFALSAPTAYAQGLIRDTEIENTIRVYTAPIFKAAGLDPSVVRIHLVNDSSLNAFVANGQRIYIHTGLLMRAEDPGEVIGVLAHETGHITGGHLARFGEGLADAQNANLIALLLGIPAAVLTGRGDVAAAALSLGNQIGTRKFLSYTRANEQAADQAAVGFLDQAGISSQGMLEFMELLTQEEKLYVENPNPYTRTHPLSRERVDFIRNHLENSKLKNTDLDPSYKVLHERMRAKLRGFILPPHQTYQLYPESDRSVPARYARAIALMQESQTPQAVAAIDALIDDYPDDPFFIELKGDILRDGARLEEAIEPYKKAIEILPWSALIRASLARTLVELNNPDYDDEAEKQLREALRYEPWMSSAWRLLATVYGRRGDFGEASLAQAEEAINQGRKEDALGHAKRALDQLPNGTPGWLRAQDIEVQASRKQE